MSIKLTTFDVTIGRLKVTFGMWNLSKIFLTIKCASSVRIQRSTWRTYQKVSSRSGSALTATCLQHGKDSCLEVQRKSVYSLVTAVTSCLKACINQTRKHVADGVENYIKKMIHGSVITKKC